MHPNSVELTCWGSRPPSWRRDPRGSSCSWCSRSALHKPHSNAHRIISAHIEIPMNRRIKKKKKKKENQGRMGGLRAYAWRGSRRRRPGRRRRWRSRCSRTPRGSLPPSAPPRRVSPSFARVGGDWILVGRGKGRERGGRGFGGDERIWRERGWGQEPKWREKFCGKEQTLDNCWVAAEGRGYFRIGPNWALECHG